MVECSFMSGCGFESHCSHKLDGLWFKICMTKVYTLITIRLRDNDLSPIVSSRVETPLFLRKPPFWVPPSFWSKFKKLPPLSESHPNWCMQIVRNTLEGVPFCTFLSQLRTSLTLPFLLPGSTLSLLLTLSLVTYWL